MHIQELLNKRAIVHSKCTPGDFVSTVFLCPKKSGSYRLILNLKQFNRYAEKIKFKMESLTHILSLVTKGCFMTLIDLLDAYLTLPVKREDCSYLKFFFQGQIFMYIALPFGYTGSPRIFAKVLRPLVAKLRLLGHVVTFYLDDSWQSANSYTECHRTCAATYNLLLACGFLPNMSKSMLTPSQCVEILGTVVNSRTMTIYLPTKKEQDMLQLLKECLKVHHLTIRCLARIIGKLVSCFPVCPLG